MILITQDDFTSRTGIDLAQEDRDSNMSSADIANISIERWERYVYNVAYDMGFTISDNNLTQFQIEKIKDAVANYGAFCLLNGDWESLQNGNDPTPNIIKTLRNCGIIRNGFKGR